MRFAVRFLRERGSREELVLHSRGVNPPQPPFSKGGRKRIGTRGCSPLCKRGGRGDSFKGSFLATDLFAPHCETNP